MGIFNSIHYYYRFQKHSHVIYKVKYYLCIICTAHIYKSLQKKEGISKNTPSLLYSIRNKNKKLICFYFLFFFIAIV